MFKIEGLNGVPLRYENCTFENFFPNEMQTEAVKACRAYAQGEAHRDGQGLFFYGLSGSGKTHLATATAKALLQAHPGYYGPAEFVSVVQMTHESQLLSISHPLNPVNECLKAPLLVLDDLGSEPPDHPALSLLNLIIDSRYQTCSPTLITSTLDVAELEDAYGTNFVGRIFGMCRPIHLRGDDYRVLMSDDEWPGGN